MERKNTKLYYSHERWEFKVHSNNELLECVEKLKANRRILNLPPGYKIENLQFVDGGLTIRSGKYNEYDKIIDLDKSDYYTYFHIHRLCVNSAAWRNARTFEQWEANNKNTKEVLSRIVSGRFSEKEPGS